MSKYTDVGSQSSQLLKKGDTNMKQGKQTRSCDAALELKQV